MRILLTNDDGIAAPGILALHRAISGRVSGEPMGEVLTVAPLTVQSATSHGVTFHQPLMVRAADVNGDEGIAVDGRPADCAKLALTNLWPERYGDGRRPDLVISGMNAGANVGVNVIYSGTVAAAIEAAFIGVPSIAVSLHLGKGAADFDRAAACARRVLDTIVSTGPIEPHTCINVNIPATEFWEADPAIVVCPMNTHALVDRYERRLSPGGDVYYWASGDGMAFRGADAGTDVAHLFERHVVVTPLRFDLTDSRTIDAWRSRFGSEI